MVRYFIRQTKEGDAVPREVHDIVALIDDRYYWNMKWFYDEAGIPTVTDCASGFLINDKIDNLDDFTEVEFQDLHSTFGSFADYLERAINAYKSYVLWIAPTPASPQLKWRFNSDGDSREG